MAIQKPAGYDPKEQARKEGIEPADDQLGNSRGNPRSEQTPNPIIQFVDAYFGTIELTQRDSAYVPDTFLKPYNPDPLVQKDQTYSIYTSMADDDQVSVAMELKRDLILAAGYDFVVEGDDELSLEIKKDLEVAFCEDPEIGFDESLEGLTSAYQYGFCLAEKVFKNRPDGSLTLKFVKERHPGTWLIHTDDQGNVEKFEQRVRTGNIKVNPKALIHFVNRPLFQNPYGRSDLRSAYAAYFIKQQITKYYGIFMEKAASPAPVARYDTNAPQQAVDAIYDAIKRFQTKTALVVPKAIELEFLESKNDGEVFAKAINIFNMFIGRALMIPDLLGFQGAETSGGSYSLGKDQIEILFKHIHKRRAALEKLINKELVWPIVFHNWGMVEKYPKFKLRPIQDQVLVDLAHLWLDAAKSKVWKASDEEINHFRKLAKFPEGEVEREAPPINPLDPMNPLDPNAQHDPGQEQDVSGDPEKKGDGSTGAQGEDSPGEQGKELPPGKKPAPLDRTKSLDPKEGVASEKPNPAKKDFKAGGDRPTFVYEKKVDFKMIDRGMKSFLESVMAEVRPIAQRSVDAFMQDLRDKRILQKQDPSQISGMNLKFLPKIASAFRKNFREAYREAQVVARTELERGANYALNPEAKKVCFAEPTLPPEGFLKVLAAELDEFIGDWEYGIKKRVRIEIIRAIKDGLPISDVEGVLDDVGNELTEAQMERWARTKFTEVMNRGRLDFFDGSGVVEAYEYSAILDDRTSEVCAGLDGKVFKAGDQPIPPMHFNCRSLLVPITKYEEWEADRRANGGEPLDRFIEDNKGTGFAVQ